MRTVSGNSSFYVCCLAFLCFFAGCHVQKGSYNSRELQKYVHRLQGGFRMEDYKAIVYLSENTCPSCNHAFSQAVGQYALGNDSLLVIVNAKGRTMNLTPYWEYDGKNLIFDYTDNFLRLRLSTGSCIILLKECQIDSVVFIQPDNLDDSVDYLKHL